MQYSVNLSRSRPGLLYLSTDHVDTTGRSSFRVQPEYSISAHITTTFIAREPTLARSYRPPFLTRLGRQQPRSGVRRVVEPGEPANLNL